jgi:hypothetical protein
LLDITKRKHRIEINSVHQKYNAQLDKAKLLVKHQEQIIIDQDIEIQEQHQLLLLSARYQQQQQQKEGHNNDQKDTTSTTTSNSVTSYKDHLTLFLKQAPSVEEQQPQPFLLEPVAEEVNQYFIRTNKQHDNRVTPTQANTKVTTKATSESSARAGSTNRNFFSDYVSSLFNRNEAKKESSSKAKDVRTSSSEEKMNEMQKNGFNNNSNNHRVYVQLLSSTRTQRFKMDLAHFGGIVDRKRTKIVRRPHKKESEGR